MLRCRGGSKVPIRSESLVRVQSDSKIMISWDLKSQSSRNHPPSATSLLNKTVWQHRRLWLQRGKPKKKIAFPLLRLNQPMSMLTLHQNRITLVLLDRIWMSLNSPAHSFSFFFFLLFVCSYKTQKSLPWLRLPSWARNQTTWEYIHSGRIILPAVLPKVHHRPEPLYVPTEVNARQVDGLARIPGLTQALYKWHPQPPNSVLRPPTSDPSKR